MKSCSTQIVIIIIKILFFFPACSRIENEELPVISTEDIQIFPDGFIVFNGSVVSTGTHNITDHGFCWSGPDLKEAFIRMGPCTSPGAFTSQVSDLRTGTTYLVSAFASTGSDTVFGEEKPFITPDTFVVNLIDIDQNLYPTVKIGDQIWMAANLKVTRYSDGTKLRLVEDKQTWYDFNLYAQAYCWYDNFIATGFIYGGLYTWPAAMRVTDSVSNSTGPVQGVCPVGWHIPSDREWRELELYLGMSIADADTTGWRGTIEGGKLKSSGTQYWESPNTGATNESGFNAFGGGWRYGSGYDRDFGKSTVFWSSSMKAELAWIRKLDYNSSSVYRYFTGLYEGLSVRCVKNRD